MKIPFGPFEPDKSEFNPAVSGDVTNVLPVANGWGPMPALIEVSDALPSACMGAALVRTSAGSYKILAGTASGLYELNNADYSWTDITGTSGPYNATDRWTFTRYGNKVMIHQINDPIQQYDIDAGGDVTDLGGNPPNARYSWVAGDFLVLGNLSGTGGERQVQWSGVNDAEHWTIGSKGADYQELPEGGDILGGFGDQGGFFVMQREGMQYFPFALNTKFVFGRTVVNPTKGAISARSLVNIGNGRFFYLSEDGFFSDMDRKPIGAERVDSWFLNQLDATSIADVQGASDPFQKMVWWSFMTSDQGRLMLGYDWQLDRWCTSDLVVGDLIPLTTLGMTWDGLDSFFADIADAIAPFDSRFTVGGRPTLATFNSDNKLCYFAGANLTATLTTNFVELIPGSRSFVGGVRVTTDAPSLTITDTMLDYHGGTETVSSSSSINRAGLVPMRCDARLHKFTLNIPEETVWSIISDIDVPAIPSGQQ